MKSLDFEAAFGAPGQHEDQVQTYLHDVRENWRLSETAASRAMVTILILSTAFVLLDQKGIGEVSVAGIKVTNLDFIAIATPVFIAYLWSTVISNMRMSAVLRNLHDGLYGHHWPERFKQDLEMALRPHGSVSFANFAYVRMRPGLLAEATIALDVLRGIVYIVGPVVMVLYCLVTVWQGDIALIPSIAVTALSGALILGSLPSLIVGVRDS